MTVGVRSRIENIKCHWADDLSTEAAAGVNDDHSNSGMSVLLSLYRHYLSIFVAQKKGETGRKFLPSFANFLCHKYRQLCTNLPDNVLC